MGEYLLNIEDQTVIFHNYRVNTSVFYDAIQVLLNHGANPNQVTAAGRSSLEMLLYVYLNTKCSLLINHIDTVLNCTELLCKMGASPSLNLSMHVELTGLLMNIGLRILLIRDEFQKHFFSNNYKKLVFTMLKYGLKTNHYNSTPYSSSNNGYSGNILMEIACLAQYVRN